STCSCPYENSMFVARSTNSLAMTPTCPHSGSTPRTPARAVDRPVQLLLLRRKRRGVGGAEPHPLLELALRPHVVGRHPQPSLHGPPAHHRLFGRRGLDEAIRLRRVDPHEHAALPAGGDGHVPA